MDDHVRFDRVFVPRLEDRDIFHDAFGSITRQAGRNPEVAVFLHRSLGALAEIPRLATEAERYASLLLHYGDHFGGWSDSDRQQIEGAGRRE